MENTHKDIEFFSISPKRLIIASIGTLGFYQLYWFYQNWRAVKKAEGTDISPFWRSVFAIFFCYGLFKRIIASAKEDGYPSPGLPTVLAATYVALNLVGNQVTMLVRLSNVIPLLAVQDAINFHEKKNGRPQRSGFTRGEIITIVIGIALPILAFAVAFLVAARHGKI